MRYMIQNYLDGFTIGGTIANAVALSAIAYGLDQNHCFRIEWVDDITSDIWDTYYSTVYVY